MITHDEPSVKPASRYSINETCAILTISRKTLAKYTRSGYIKCGIHKNTLRKFYLGREIIRFWRATV